MASEILTTSEFVRRFPWPEDLSAQGKPLEYLWRYEFDCAASALWPSLIETSRFNRALGLGEMSLEERDGVLHGASRNGGVLHQWVEVPWDWISGDHLVVTRRYTRGFAHSVRVVYLLQPLSETSHRLYVYFGWIPRGVLGRLAIRAGMPSLDKGYRRILTTLVAELKATRPAVLQLPAPQLRDDGRTRMMAIRDTLVERGLPAAIVDRLVEFIREADDMDAYRMQVRALAHRWSMDERELLNVCLHATREGLLDMSWDVICPHCRGVREETNFLGEIGSRSACDVCEIDFGTDAENAVEITFHVHPSVREVPKVYYCSAEPSTKLHIRIQQGLSPGERRTLATDLEAGRYRLRARGDVPAKYIDVVDDSSSAAEIVWKASAPRAEQRVGLRPRIELVNDSETEQQVVVETVKWADVALRPAELFNVQEFRDLFAEEYLGADVQLNIGEQTILFTDMVGSTQFYVDQGDPVAFVEVREHFREVFSIVGRNHGAIVKTIGDAAMAGFSNPLDAVRASKQIHERFPPVQQALFPIRLRISLNTGPCIAVNLNSAIDYFGGTVNMAAKLQACAGAGQIAMTRAVRVAPGVEEYLASQSAVLVDGMFDYAPLDPISYTRWDTEG